MTAATSLRGFGMPEHRPVMLVILDGWGWREDPTDNAVQQARTPTFDELWRSCPHAFLRTSGRDVGLPDGQMGNSEVGHLNIGAGRVVPQDLVRLGDAVRDGSIARNEALGAACDRAAASGRPLHLMGLVSDGGVHSHVDHLRALARMAIDAGVRDVRVHAITDGRDVSPHQAAGLLAELEREWAGTPVAIRTVAGRFYAMDRDHRWDRTQRYYATVVDGLGGTAPTAHEAVEASYAAGVTDEFVEPVAIGDHARDTIGRGDELVFFNFRPDRARQVCAALADHA